MPPRKSAETKSLAVQSVDDDMPARAQAKFKDGIGVEDLTLPRTMIQRLAKGMLPPNTQIQKDALAAIHKSATVFVSYLANSANDRAVLANKKTIQPKDVMDALAELEFDAFLPRCNGELILYNTMQCTKRNDYRKRVKETREQASESAILEAAHGRPSRNGDGGMNRGFSSPGGGTSNGYGAKGRDSAPAAKKARTSLAGATNGVGHNDEEDDNTVDEDEEDEEEDGEVEGETEEQSESEEGKEEDEEEGEEDDGDDGEGDGEEEMEDSLERTGARRRDYGSEDDEGGSESES